MTSKLIFVESAGTHMCGKSALVLSNGFFDENGNLIDSVRLFPNARWSEDMIVDLTKVPIVRISEQSEKIKNRNYHV